MNAQVDSDASDHQKEVISGERFEFGKNWSHFLEHLTEDRMDQAASSLENMLGVETLAGKSLIDIGSGSGIFSLAACRLGAARVHSFDFDPDSVACAGELKRRYSTELSTTWTIERGSVLDEAYVASLGQFDIVYSWGVLHHTGEMWRALSNAATLVAPGGSLYIAIYNDQGWASEGWAAVKKAYNHLPPSMRFLVLWPAFLRLWVPTTVKGLLRGKPFEAWKSYKSNRGMSAWHDVVDWVGGYPFEVAKPEQIFEFYRERGFRLESLQTCGGGKGCNEFLFHRDR